MNPDNRTYSNEACCIRAKFVRREDVKFISHLDIMRTFERALRRSHIPISYSMGFNPQPQIVFGLPLAVGVTSEAEYADFQLTKHIDTNSFIEGLNKELPVGLKILDVKYKDNTKNIMAVIGIASYIILVYTCLNLGINDIREKICAFKNEMNIMIKKEGKKRTREINIRPMVHRLNVEEYNEVYKISALLSAGGTENLRPDLLIAALNMYAELDFEIVNIHRTGLFIKKGEDMIEPLDSCALK